MGERGGGDVVDISEDTSLSSILAAMCFWSAWKGEVVNLVEVLTNEFVEVWKNLRLHPY